MQIELPSRFDAIIVGAGPAGSTAAILLARAGWSVALIEKQRFPRRKVCGECIAASNLPLLDALGIGAALRARAGAELHHVSLLHADRRVTAALPAAEHEAQPWGRALGRESLDLLLLEQARHAGAQVLQPWAGHAIRGAKGIWHCEARAVETAATLRLRSPVLIDAHGSWEELPTDHPRRPVARAGADLFAFKANFTGSPLQPGGISVLALDGAYGGMVLEGCSVLTLACCIRRDRLNSLRGASPGASAGDAVEAWLRRECRGVRRALLGASRVGPWLACGPIDPGIRVSPKDERFRIGNAAGEAHPILGEGISMALQSAALLCTHLIAKLPPNQAPDLAVLGEIQRRYAADWRQQFAPRLRLAAAFAQTAMHPPVSALLMAALRVWPGLLTQGARWGGKVRPSPALARIETPQRAPPAAHDTGSTSPAPWRAT